MIFEYISDSNSNDMSDGESPLSINRALARYFLLLFIQELSIKVCFQFVDFVFFDFFKSSQTDDLLKGIVDEIEILVFLG